MERISRFGTDNLAYLLCSVVCSYADICSLEVGSIDNFNRCTRFTVRRNIFVSSAEHLFNRIGVNLRSTFNCCGCAIFGESNQAVFAVMNGNCTSILTSTIFYTEYDIVWIISRNAVARAAYNVVIFISNKAVLVCKLNYITLASNFAANIITDVDTAAIVDKYVISIAAGKRAAATGSCIKRIVLRAANDNIVFSITNCLESGLCTGTAIDSYNIFICFL